MINLLPAILIAGPPNCGKSVLSFLLTQHLRQLGIAHYLLRAAPDGEGDWFHQGDSASVRTIRTRNKTDWTPEFIGHMRHAVEERLLPLLVDIGGRPRGDQLGILRACSHSILLYRSQSEYEQWHALLAEMQLLPIAALRSSLEEPDQVTALQPDLRGVIAGLDRSEARRALGPVFAALAGRVAGICRYDAQALERVRLLRAPLPVITERALAEQNGVPFVGENPRWSPADLPAALAAVPAGAPLAIDGRGPVWLAMALAARALPARAALFDARYGWLNLLEPAPGAPGWLQVTTRRYNHQDDWVELSTAQGVLEPGEAGLPEIPGTGGIVFSGRLPRWYFAALARHYASQRPWVGVFDARLNAAVVVASRDGQVRPGDTLLPVEL